MSATHLKKKLLLHHEIFLLRGKTIYMSNNKTIFRRKHFETENKISTKYLNGKKFKM